MWVSSAGILDFCGVEHGDLSAQQQSFSWDKERLRERHDKRLPTKTTKKNNWVSEFTLCQTVRTPAVLAR